MPGPEAAGLTYQPKFGLQRHVKGWTGKSITRLFITLGGFGTVAGFGLLFYAEGMPRVRRDILQKIPILGSYWVKEIPPSDNPF